MNFKNTFLLLTCILSLYFPNKLIASSGYIGSDDRKEASELPEALKVRAKSIVTVVRRFENNHVAGGGYKFNIKNQNPLDLKICPDQKFSEQIRPSEVVCGGTLISSDLVLTAHHCIQEGSDCTSDYSFVFGYTQGQTEFSPSDVYHCQEIILQKNSHGSDMALIRLDRPVSAHTPVPLFTEGLLAEGETVRLVGPHAKLPIKTSLGKIKYIETDSEILNSAVGTDLDCHSDDSGSAVLNSEGQLIGVLVAANALNSPQPTQVLPNLMTEPKEAPAVEMLVANLDSSTPVEDKITEPESTAGSIEDSAVVSNTDKLDTKSQNETNDSALNTLSADPTSAVSTPEDLVPMDMGVQEFNHGQCLAWSAVTSPVRTAIASTAVEPKNPSNERNLYQPVIDTTNDKSKYIPKGCAFSPISHFIKEISDFLPEYQKIIRTPTHAIEQN